MHKKNVKKFKKIFVEISQKQNLPIGDFITIYHETIRKISLFFRNMKKEYLEDLSGFLSLHILDFPVDLS